MTLGSALEGLVVDLESEVETLRDELGDVRDELAALRENRERLLEDLRDVVRSELVAADARRTGALKHLVFAAWSMLPPAERAAFLTWAQR